MAVVTTPQDILNGAYAKSMKNDAGTIATESTELLEVVIRAMRGLYAFAARVNPTFFAETASVAFSSPGWARPASAESVFKIEMPSGLSQHGLLAIDATPESFKTSQVAYYKIAGVLYSKVATTGISFTAAHTVNTGAAAGTYWGAILVQIDAGGTISTKVVAADQAYSTEALAISNLPAPDASNVALGHITVNSNSGAAWTGNTDDLTDGSDCVEANFYNASAWSNFQVVTVPFDDPTAESGLPAVFSFGQIYRPAGNSNDPTSGNLTFYYAKRPDDPASLSSTLDALWTEQFNELLILEVAIYLALKDSGSGRETELGGLMKDRDKWAQLFIAFLEHETSNERRRFGHTRRFNTNTMVPLGQLLAGGSSLQLGPGQG